MSDPAEEVMVRWSAAAEGWGRRADQIARVSQPVTDWLLEHVDPRPGERVLELAAGPGDVGFAAAERIAPGGRLVCSDISAPMLDVARARARQRGLTDVEFAVLDLDRIDVLPASVDVVVCRWAVMLVADPGEALREIHRVLRPGGRAAVAVWDVPAANPWVSIPTGTLIGLGHAEPPAPEAPGMFALADPDRLRRLLEQAGFTQVTVERVDVPREYDDLDALLAEMADLAPTFSATLHALSADQRDELVSAMSAQAAPYLAGARLRLPGSSLVAACSRAVAAGG